MIINYSIHLCTAFHYLKFLHKIMIMVNRFCV